MSSRRALAFSFLDRYAGLLLAIGSSMVVARLLTPAEIGVFSVAMVLLSFVSAMRDFGAGQYLVQEKELTTERIRATWTVQLGLGVGFALIVAAAALPVSMFYREPRLLEIMLLLAVNFAVSPFGSLTYAWLMREMRFDVLAVMRFTGSLVGACVSVGMAWRGFGPISLAAGSLATTIANALVATWFRPSHFPWRPGLAGVRRVLSFGGKVSATTVVNTIGYSVPELVLGKFQGMTAVGLYSRANGLAGMFHRLILDATQSVAMPLFSKASRQGESLEPIFMRATAYVTAIGWSFFGVMAVHAEAIVRLLYGTQWSESVPLARFIAASVAIGLPAAFCNTVLVATGEMNTLVRTTVVTTVQMALFLGAGALLGLPVLAWTIVAAAVIGCFVWLSRTPMRREVSAGRFAQMLLRSLAVAAAGTAASALGLLWSVDHVGSHLLRLATGGAAALLVIPAMVYVVKHPLRDELDSVPGLLRRLLPGGRKEAR